MPYRYEQKYKVEHRTDENGQTTTTKTPIMDPAGRPHMVAIWEEPEKKDRTLAVPTFPEIPDTLKETAGEDGVAYADSLKDKEDLSEDEQAFLTAIGFYVKALEEYNQKSALRDQAMAKAEAKRERRKEKAKLARAKGGAYA